MGTPLTPNLFLGLFNNKVSRNDGSLDVLKIGREIINNLTSIDSARDSLKIR